MDSNLSLSDIAAVTRGNYDGFGDGNGWWIILILLFALGGNGFGYGRGVDGRIATVEDVNNSANFTRLEDQLRGITYGISDATYALNNNINTLGYRELENYSNLRYENAIGQKELSAQIADCCCKTQKAIADEGAATRELIQTNKIEALRDKVNDLELQSALCGVIRYPNSTTYTGGPNPFFGSCCNNGNI